MIFKPIEYYDYCGYVPVFKYLDTMYYMDYYGIFRISNVWLKFVKYFNKLQYEGDI